jgi:ATP-dependent exoDNAse (exonuclease V) alpha subunit
MLTPHQQEIFDKILNDIESANDFGQCFYGSLEGPAGTGKSFLTSHLVKHFLKSTEGTVTATTPTHKSLKVLNDMLKSVSNSKLKTRTIHSFLCLKMQQKEDQMLLVPDQTLTPDLKTKVLLVDESSMVSSELFKYIEKQVKLTGIKVVLFIGDSVQLMPVDGKPNPVFTSVNRYQLTEVVRQAKDSPILNAATTIRYEIENKTFNLNVLKSFKHIDDHFVLFNDETELLKDFCLNPNKDKILSAFTNAKVDYYNQFARAYEHRFLQPIPQFVEGEKLVMNEAYYPDNQDSGVKNGDDFFVQNLEEIYDVESEMYVWKFLADEIPVRVVSDKSHSVYQAKLKLISEKAKQLKSDKYFKESSDMWKEFWSVKSKYADVKYAHASTVHKLQGSTVEEIYINLRDTIQSCRDKETLFRLVYVALTRARFKVKVLV